jgi:hypothetical protein
MTKNNSIEMINCTILKEVSIYSNLRYSFHQFTRKGIGFQSVRPELLNNTKALVEKFHKRFFINCIPYFLPEPEQQEHVSEPPNRNWK